MSRSLFALLNRRYGPKIDGATRREFLKATLAASAGLLISRDYAFGQAKKSAPRIAVIGAGFAGLACAYELLAAGYDVTVIESRDRVGGRVLSFGDFVPNKNVEGGGELIGSNHPTWVAYKELFGFEWLDVSEGEEEAPIILGGKRLSEDESNKLWEEMDAVLQRMNADAENIDADAPWTSPNAAELDKKSGKDWIDAQKDLSDLCRLGVWINQAADNGQDPAKQSYLGNLTQIKGGGVEKYWTDSEVFRCKGGNQQLATKLAEKIGNERIILGLPVNGIDGRRDKLVITCRDGRTIEVDDVVMTVPPSVWKKISINPALPPALAPQMGTNVKYLASAKSAFWKDAKLAPDSLTDQFACMTWDGTDGQGEEGGTSMNCFSGGPAAEKALAIPKDERDAKYAELLGSIYPAYKENFVKSRFMDWPNEQWTGAGYSFPAPGQVTTVGPLLARGAGRLHFAGEHCSYKFVGYMEGALNSGVTVAKRLAVRDGLIKPEATTSPAPPNRSTAPASAPALVK